jgi:hypothetical protein
MPFGKEEKAKVDFVGVYFPVGIVMQTQASQNVGHKFSLLFSLSHCHFMEKKGSC